LAAAHHDLEVTHALTAALHNSADVEAVQDQVLLALTSQLGFRRAVVGLVDIQGQAITGWLGRIGNGQTTTMQKPLHPARLPLTPDSGPAIQALLEGKPYRATDEACTVSQWINEQFGMQGCMIMPMHWGIQPIGILMVDLPEDEAENSTRMHALEAIAQQTAVALGMMMTRLRRARESAVDAERARLALDIHDTVSQSLFGIVFALDGLLKMWPAEPEVTRAELEHALRAAETVRQDIRQTIHDLWQEEITAAAFEDNLRRYVSDVLLAHHLQIRFDIRGDFSALSSRARRSLYRIAQESLANVVQHAAASQARVCVDVENERASLVVSDDGRGFEPRIALALDYEQGHFGLRGMEERARSLGGTCDIFSQPDAGASIVIDIPLKR
jgi:signal transduction histidine kinase